MSIHNILVPNNLDCYVNDLHVNGTLYANIPSGDITPGLNGQVLSTVGSNVEWADLPGTGTITSVEDDSISSGTGTLVVNSPVTSGSAQIKKIIAGSNITLTNGTNDLTINSTNPGGTITRIEDDTVSIGTGTLVVASPVTSGIAQIKKLVQGTGITLTNGIDDVTINGNIGTITTIQNNSVSSGTGTLVVASPVTSGVAQIKKLVAGSNITLTNGTNDITIASSGGGGGTITGVRDGTASTGTGTLVISSPVTSGVAQIKKLIAGSNITLTNGTNDVTITSTASGGGAGTEYSVAAAASDLPLLTSYRNITLTAPTTDGYPGKTSFLNTITSTWTPTIGTKYMVSWNVYLLNTATTGSIVSLTLYHGGTSPYTLLQENYCPSSTNGGMLTLNGTIMFSTAYSATMYFQIKKTDSSSSIKINSSQTTFTVYSLN